jgi:peptidase E
MSTEKGVITLMGSGELTATMVEVHKELLSSGSSCPQAVFLDTPAGFQLNVDQLSERAIDYFRSHVQQDLVVASYKSTESATPYEAEQAFQRLRQADFVLIGPGSPTYAVRQWRQSPIPDILIERIEAGGCLVAASAAALTVGRFTLPVYEIYKVGQEIHWVEGMNILEHFGFNLVVVPHWNNAEGGNHDTRFCYMGEPRFKQLEALLPQDTAIFGLDEHTACLIDFEKEEAEIRGIGSVTLRRHGAEIHFEKGDRFPIEVLRGGEVDKEWQRVAAEGASISSASKTEGSSFWEKVHAVETTFREGLENHQQKETTNALLEMDRMIWEAQEDLENSEYISQARDILRELIVALGTRLEISPRDRQECIAPLVGELLDLRETFRGERQWKGADAIRESLTRANIVVEDTKEGPKWRLP